MIHKKLLLFAMLPPLATGVFLFIYLSGKPGASVALLVIPAGLIIAVATLSFANAEPERDPRLDFTPSVKRGRADLIRDPGDMPWQWVAEALKTEVENEAVPDDPAWNYEYNPDGEALGLKTTRSPGEYDEALRMVGNRHGRQVKIRLGKREGVVSMPLRRKHYREITLVRAELPEFEIAAVKGSLRADGRTPQEVVQLVRSLKNSPMVWRNLLIVAGPEGIVANRKAPSGRSKTVMREANRWVYDLWLLERITELLNAPPLPHIAVDELVEEELPYKMGRWTG